MCEKSVCYWNQCHFRDPRRNESACEKLNPGSQEPSGKMSPGILGQVCKKGKTRPVNRNIKPPGPGASGKHIRKRPSLWAAWEGAQHLWGLYGHRKTYRVNSRSHNSTVIKKMGSQIATPIHPLLNTKTNSTLTKAYSKHWAPWYTSSPSHCEVHTGMCAVRGRAGQKAKVTVGTSRQ